MYTGNTPQDETILRLQARKSFAFGVWVEDFNGNPLDIVNSSFRMVARKSVPSTVNDDSGNLLTNSHGTVVAAALGFVRFSLQASELDWEPGEYGFTIVISEGGYSAVLVKGTIVLEENAEFTSMTESYIPNDISTALRVALREQVAIYVKTGPTLAPGQATFSIEDEQHLDELYASAVAKGEVLNADLIPDGTTKVMMTTAERNKLANLTLNWTDIQGKPAFGTASLRDEPYFVRTGAGAASDIVSGTFTNTRIPKVILLQGISEGTAAPASGNPFSIYLKHA
jgi:hypothetical protein